MPVLQGEADTPLLRVEALPEPSEVDLPADLPLERFHEAEEVEWHHRSH